MARLGVEGAWLSYRRAAQIPGSAFNGSGRDSVMVRQVRSECRHWLVSQGTGKHYAIYRQPRCARCLPAAMRGLRIVRIISSLICDGGAFPSGPALLAGKDPFPGGESRSSGIPGAVARNGAPLSSPRLRQTSPAGLVLGQSRSANAEVEAMTAMMHRAALTAVNLSINSSCERTQEQGCASMRMLVADRRTVSAFHGMSNQLAVCGRQSPVSAKPSVSRSTWRRPSG